MSAGLTSIGSDATSLTSSSSAAVILAVSASAASGPNECGGLGFCCGGLSAPGAVRALARAMPRHVRRDAARTEETRRDVIIRLRVIKALQTNKAESLFAGELNRC